MVNIGRAGPSLFSGFTEIAAGIVRRFTYLGSSSGYSNTGSIKDL